VPFRIEELSDERDVIIKLKGCDSSEDMGKYQLLSLHLLSSDITIVDEQPLTKPHILINMIIHDINNGIVGEIIRVEEYPQQLMAIVLDQDDQELLIPLHESLIKEISHETKMIKMDLPEGLI